MNNVYMLLALLAGSGVAIQAVVNARLRVTLGAPVWAASAQFLIGLIVLLAVAMLTRQAVPPGNALARSFWWEWIGGIFGAIFILTTVIVTPRLGASVTIGSTIVGQLLTALVLDHFGWFGAPVSRLSVTRVAGALLLVGGALLLRSR